MSTWILSGVGHVAHFLARSEIDKIEKTVTKTKDSFFQGLKNGNADAWSIVIIATIVIVGGGLAAWYFKNRG
jgi:hypothetical protein